ncbi:MAG: AAA family ATPase [Clostridia bacterium]|nr:AAA family ATPase [Clostridia bacterium]
MKKYLKVVFSKNWIMDDELENSLIVEALLDYFREEYNSIDIIESGLLTLILTVNDEKATKDDVLYKLKKQLHTYAKGEKIEDICKYEVSEVEGEISSIEEESEEETEKKERQRILDKIEGLIGAEQFKALAKECIDIAPLLIKNNTVEAFIHRTYLFAINEGEGLSTYISVLGELLQNLGLITLGFKRRPLEINIAYANSKDSDPFANAYSYFTRTTGDTGKIICVNLSEWMSELNDQRVKKFLDHIDKNMGRNIIIFRVPFVEKEVLHNIHTILSDRFSVKDVSFVPFDIEELKQYAQSSLKTRGYTVEEDAWELFKQRISEEKSDGKFYGTKTVNKVIREMIYLKTLDNSKNGKDDKTVKKCEIESLVLYNGEKHKSGIEMLDEFIGMENIKNKVLEIVGQIEMSIKNENLGAPCIHMKFVGNPGTGKTTVARVIGKVLKERGVLRNGGFFEYRGRDFVGRYIGETAPKTTAMCRDAYGSVLFIDEAYSLYRGPKTSGSDFGKEAIDTLIAEMENHRKDLVVIMAGYPEEMEDLMGGNAGLESRLPYTIEFPNYTREQLFEIFMSMVNKSFKYKEGFEECAKEYFLSLPESVFDTKEFSNARFARNLFERTWGKATLRWQLYKEETMELSKEDFIAASNESDFAKNLQKNKRMMGFMA